MTFQGQVVWITGASSGIGEAMAKDFARRGAQVILTARRVERLNQLAESIHQELGKLNVAKVLEADLLKFEESASLVERAIKLFGKVDVLLNNAGASQRSLAMSAPLEVDQKIINLDLISPIALTKAIFPHMAARKSGRIIVTSSLMGYLELPGNTTYACVKHGLNGYFLSLSYEVKKHGILVQVMEPGFVKTEITLSALTADGKPFGKMNATHSNAMSAEEFSRRVFPKIESNQLEIVVAGKEKFALIARRWFPKLYHYLIQKFAVQVLKDRF